LPWLIEQNLCKRPQVRALRRIRTGRIATSSALQRRDRKSAQRMLHPV
jgi:hypothetical protein